MPQIKLRRLGHALPEAQEFTTGLVAQNLPVAVLRSLRREFADCSHPARAAWACCTESA